VSRNSRIKAVVAENEYIISLDIRRVLKEAGYELVGEASDGVEAVEAVCSLRPDVVIMDIGMPELDGLEAAACIQDRCPTPVVVMTAYESKYLVERAGEVGVGAYLLKPPNTSEIKRAVSIAMARHGDLMKIRKSLREKEMLIREIHHRVKNNLTVISSLLELQSGQINDDAAMGIFDEARNRVNSMSMIHDRLYRLDDLSGMDFSEYLCSLTEQLFRNYRINDSKVRLDLNVQDLILDIDTVIPCGLIVNELVSNALKHAFPEGSEGVLNVELKKGDNDEATLIIRDNGVGIPGGLDIHNVDTLGMQIVTSLAAQIDGRLELQRENGTGFMITFRDKDLNR
jgi:two-component sensor histidine kinase